MGCFGPERLPRDPEAAQARRDARVVLQVARARLARGEPLDAQPLTVLALDERLAPRQRARAAEYLARGWLAAASAVGGR